MELEGETLLARAVRRLAAWFPAVVVAVRRRGDPVPAGALAVADAEPGAGPLSALAGALARCATPWAFAVGCDMPDLDRAVVEFLVARARPDVDAVVPVDADGCPQPLHAVYRVAAGPSLAAAAAAGERALHRALAALRCDAVPWAAWRDLPGAAASMAGLDTAQAIAARRAVAGSPA